MLRGTVTISISISQIFRSWVAIHQLRPPMASLSYKLYDIPGLAPRMNVLFWGRHDFQISVSNLDTPRNAWHRHWRIFIVDTVILSNNTKFLSHKFMLNGILQPDQYNENSPPIRRNTNPWPFYRTRPFTDCPCLMQNRESTEGYLRGKDEKRYGKVGKTSFCQQLEHKQVPIRGTKPGVRKGKRSLLASHTRCKCSMETVDNIDWNCNFVG